MVYSSAECFGKAFREFASIFVPRNGILSCFLYRARLWNVIPRVCFYFCSTEPVLRIRDVYPGSWFLPILDPGSRILDPGSRIPVPKTATKERGENKFVVIPFYVDTNFAKFNIFLVLKCWRRKFRPIFKDLKNFLPQNLSLSSQKNGFGIRDLRSGIQKKKPIPGDPGVKKASVSGTGSATLQEGIPSCFLFSGRVETEFREFSVLQNERCGTGTGTVGTGTFWLVEPEPEP